MSEMIRALVTGSRTWDRPDWVINVLTLLAMQTDQLTIVHGACETGVDRIVHDWVASSPLVTRPVPLGTLPNWAIPYTEFTSGGPIQQPVHITEDPFPAAWGDPCGYGCQPGHRKVNAKGEEYCPAQGIYRNTAMVDSGADVCLAFIRNRSRGASDCAGQARAAGIPTLRWVA